MHSCKATQQGANIMQIKRGVLAGIAAVGLALGTGLAMAKEGGHRHHGFGPDAGFGQMHHVLKELDLTPEQKQTVKGIFESARPQLSTLHEQMREVRDSLMDTSPDDANYQTVVNTASQKSAELASQLILETSQIRTQVHAVLTDEQKARLPEIRAKMKEHMDERHDRMRERMEARREDRKGASDE
jgi:Spy/CpxP family protein refolding chaperone